MAGIPIGINPLWFAIVALITWSLGSTYYPDRVPGIAPGAAYALGLVSALLLFASIVLHELGHAVVARRRGIRVEGIDLWLLGGVSKLKDSPHGPDDELRFAAAGPAVTAVIAAFFGALELALPSGTPEVVRALVTYQLVVNVAILGFNLVPAFPLDGGRILRALIWRRVGDEGRATRAAAAGGRAFAYVLIALGALAAFAGAIGGLWLALIGGFLLLAGRAEEAQQEMEAAFTGREARELMALPAITVPASISVEEAARAFFARYRFQAFPVVEGEDVVGLLTMASVEGLPRARWARTTVGTLADRDRDLLIDEHTDVAALLRRPAFARTGRAIVLTAGGEVGIISATEVRRALAAARLVDDSGDPGPSGRVAHG